MTMNSKQNSQGINKVMTTVTHIFKLSVGVALIATTMLTNAYADVSQSDVERYAAAMKAAANSQSIDQVSQLIADDAIISITRNNKSATMGKAEYLQRLQSVWSSSSNYSYTIEISNVVTTGKKAKADINTVESFNKDGKPVKFITSSRATLTESGKSSAMLLKSVSQVTIN